MRRTGLESGDILTRFNGTELSETSVSGFVRLVRKTEPHHALELLFSRQGERRTATVTLEVLAAK